MIGPSAPNGPPVPIEIAEDNGFKTATRGSIRLRPKRIASNASGIPWPRIFSEPKRAIIPMISPPITGTMTTMAQENLSGARIVRAYRQENAEVARFVAEAGLRPGVTAAETWRVRHRDGTWLHTETVAANLLEDPNVRGLVLNTRDVSDRKELEAQLVHQAFHDGLTGLANRTLFAERVEHTLARSGRDDLAVLFIDLDDFKHVNDSLGHAAGDQLLVAAARRLQGCLRPTDTAARLGGDEFAVLLERVTDADAAVGVAGRVLDTLHQPFGLNGRTIPIKASLGAAVGRDTERDVAGYVERIGPNRWRLIMPRPHFESVMDVMELIPVQQ